MKMLKQFFLAPALAVWIVCAGLVVMSSCGSNRGSASQKDFPGNTMDEPHASAHGEEGTHEGEAAEGHATEHHEEATEKKSEHAADTTEAKTDSTEAKADTTAEAH